ncbi:MAG TPA: LPS assembly protein LptD, partial [Chromatiaceae bacterium]|nr:LPS assembly protein LptD [Chromatiaceae bacterium]
VYIPYENQDDIPLFDTGLLDFTFDNLFRGNRFNGPDRVGDANQLALALTSRLIGNDSGRELLRASIGRVFYFDELKVQLNPADPPLDHQGSSLIAELSTELFSNWLLRAGMQLDPNQSDRLRQGLAQATWRTERGKILHLGWRKREELLEQTDLAAIWPVSQKLRLIGRWYYSVQESHTLEAVAGIEYGDCCWRLRTVLRRYLDGPDEEYNTSFLMQLELNGLGSLGNNIDNFLDRTIYGY